MQTDFIYKQVYTTALDSGATETFAKQAAVNCIDRYKKNKYSGKFSAVIDKEIKQAVKLSKLDKLGKNATTKRVNK